MKVENKINWAILVTGTIKNVITSKDVVVDPNSVIEDLDESRKQN